MTILIKYVPTEQKVDDEQDEFYEKLDVYNGLNRPTIRIVLLQKCKEELCVDM